MRRTCGVSLLAVALVVGTVQTFDIHTLLDAEPTVDPNAKPCQVTQAQLDELLTPTAAASPDPTATSQYILISTKLPTTFAEAAAQHLSSLGYKVCQSAAQLPGEVTIIRQTGAQPIIYYGKRNAETLSRFVTKLNARYSGTGPAFSTITSKMERKAFERLTVPKVVAFYPDPTTEPAFVEFQEAARQLAPNPPFYVVHDAHLARKLKLNQPGQIALIHRLEKSIAYFQVEPQAAAQPQTAATPASTVTAAQIVAWITKNRGLILHELDDTNLYDPEVLDPSKYLFAAIADQTAPMGMYLHKILTKSIQNISRENEIRANLSATVDQTQLPDPTDVQQPKPQPIPLDDIEIIWIDLQKYPMAAQKLAQSANFNLANSKNKDALFGLVQVPSGVLTNAQADQWFDVSQLQSFTEKRTEEANIQLLRDWILTATDRLPQPAPAPAPEPNAAEPQIEVLQQVFSLEPEAVSVREGGNFLLDCKVQYKAGQCQWSKDGEAVEVDSASAYKWVNEQDIYDCSISVTGADAARDSGKWTCGVTETSMPDGTVVVAAIESNPVDVQVRPVKAAAKPSKAKKTTVKGEL